MRATTNAKHKRHKISKKAALIMHGAHYDHLKFFNNSDSSSSNRFSSGVQLGGVSVAPSLVSQNNPPPISSEAKQSTTEKHAEVIEYLKRLPPGVKVFCAYSVLVLYSNVCSYVVGICSRHR
ncbi:hypothetical protein EON65_21800 [archaeon]|nr:MAG: hypothetical protein EON65_21800 [archaeon]